MEIPAWVAAGAGAPGSENVAVTLLSDLHYPEIVDPKQVYGLNAYDARIAELRIKNFFEGGARISNEIFPTTPIKGTVQFWMGDMLSGNIHEELQQTNDFDLLEAVLRLAGILTAGVKLHLQLDEKPLHVICVPGNHPRLSKKPKSKGYNTDNVDWLLYHLVAREFVDEPRVTFQVGTATDHQVQVNGFTFHVTHGDQARGGSGILGAIGPIMRLDMKKRKWAMQTGNEYDYLLTGHFHTFVPNLQGVVINGSIVGYNEYASRNNLSYQTPQQGYFLVHQTRGITYSTPIFVEHEEEGWRDGEVQLSGVHSSIDVSEEPLWLTLKTE
jgi:predicted phosphodiesterase